VKDLAQFLPENTIIDNDVILPPVEKLFLKKKKY